ncbi:MAG TPA: Gfo/Idh/MocA family oxidoreductase [Terrimicrobiaceae bacterium]|nr:Gfo/Idh/MocA family oxidoreductase [Terrimicrobiaceae bacterium]
MQNSTIPVGVLGLGRAGWNIHINQLKNHPRFRVVEVADPDPERRAEAEKELGCRTFASRDEMLAEGASSLVVVATPNTCHEEDALAVAKSGRDCLLEKPVSTSYAGAERVARAFAENGRRVFPHHQHLFSPEHQILRGLLDSGKLGEVFEIRYHWVNFARRNDWQTLRKNGGGHYNNNGPHALSTMLNLLDAPLVSLIGDARHIKDAGDADDHASFVLKAANGRAGVLLLTTACAAPLPKFVVFGSTGSAWAHEEPGKVRVKYFDPSAVPALEVRDGAAAGRAYGSGEKLPWQEEVLDTADQPLGKFHDNVAAVLLDGAEPVVTAQSAVEVARALEWGLTGNDPAARPGSASR